MHEIFKFTAVVVYFKKIHVVLNRELGKGRYSRDAAVYTSICRQHPVVEFLVQLRHAVRPYLAINNVDTVPVLDYLNL